MSVKCSKCGHWVTEVTLIFKEVDRYTADKKKLQMDYDMQAEPVCKSCFKEWSK